MFILSGGKLIQVVDAGWGSVGVWRGLISFLSTLLQWGHDNVMKLYFFTFFLWVWLVF